MYIYYTDSYTGGRDVSRSILKEALALHLVSASRDISVLEHEGGKPYIEGGPEFSVSHSGNYWVCLVSDGGPCGVDIQVPRRAGTAGVARRFYSKREAELTEKLGDDFFFKIWTRREALVKCAGRSIFADDIPELIMPRDREVIRVMYDGAMRAVSDLELPIDLYAALSWTVEDEWTPVREVPMMKLLDF